MISLLNKHRHVFSHYKWSYLRITDDTKEPNTFLVDKKGDGHIIYLYNFEDPEKEFITMVFNVAIMRAITNNEVLAYLKHLRIILDELSEPITNNMLVYALELMTELADSSDI